MTENARFRLTSPESNAYAIAEEYASKISVIAADAVGE